MKTIASLVLVVLVAACASSPSPRVTAGRDLVIENVTVLPMDRETSLPHHTVIVRGDRIIAIEPADSVRVARDSIRVDGTGKWLMPGLADMHVHAWQEDQLTMFVAAGVTTVRNMFGSELHLGWRDQIAKGTLLGPTIITAGPIVDGDPAMWPSSVALAKPEDAARVVDEQVSLGYDFIKAYGGLKPDAYEALMAAAEKRGLPVGGHVPWDVGLVQVMASGQRSIEHLDGWIDAMERPGAKHDWSQYWRQIGLQIANLDPERLPALIEQARATNTFQCPTLTVWSRVSQLDDLASLRKSVRWLELVPPATRKGWEPKQDFRFGGLDAADYEVMRAMNSVLARLVGQLAAAGVPILAGTDQGNPFVVSGVSLLDELELFVSAGMTRYQALQAATTNPARFLGKSGDFGVVAKGARADLILLSTDPLTGPVPLPDGVVLRGRWLPADELRARLAAIPERYNRPRQRNVAAPAIESIEGSPQYEAHYELEESGSIFGEERVAVGLVGGKPAIVANALYDEPHTELRHRLDATSTRMNVRTSYGELQQTLRVEGDSLIADGVSFRGAPLAASLSFPSGAFLSGEGIVGSIALAQRVSQLEVGGKVTLVAFAPSYTRNPKLEQATYEIERKPDVGENKVFAVKKRVGMQVGSGELVLDRDGWPILHTLGPPYDVVIRRK